MNNRYFYLLIAILIAISFYFKQPITNNILSAFNYTKLTINNYIDSIFKSISTHFNQAEQIKILRKENKQYKDYIVQITPMLNNYKELKKFLIIQDPKLYFTQTISYAKLPDITSIYVTYNENNISTPRGLVYNNQAAGIVVKSIKNFSLAYLNNNDNTSYTVYIGKNKIPGVLFGGKHMIIKYIPKYKKINIGDLVKTSGLDTIFYEGINVGRVISITQQKLYQEVEIQPFYNPLHPTFFYVVKNNEFVK